MDHLVLNYILTYFLKDCYSTKPDTDTSEYLLFREAWVNHKHHAINGERGLGNVCRDHHFAANSSIGFIGRSRLKDPLLQVWRESGVERYALNVSYLRSKVLHFTLDTLASLLDFLETEQKSKTINQRYNTRLRYFN